ncbi:unnamed protein product [Aureobasidium vineae]|uniref:Uncharacterized protein n=1 Tax=Aureobasidium vineae TaxID=2773715 RepID=A0A9N8JW95_9PEZI|nr:unnamed protein product [Aureobasidium vineae]
MSSTVSTFKRKREALDQGQKACNDFIANLVDATSQKTTEDVIPVRSDELFNMTNGLTKWKPGEDYNLWGKDLTETIKAMRMYRVAENVSFFRIAYAIHRLEAGFNICCAYQGCKGNALIITPEFQPVNVFTRSGYPRDQAEHAVFLASNCCHEFTAFQWRRSRVEEGDLTPLYLLQQAHSNPILNQFTQLKAGITTRDLDLEYDAMLELEKQRQAVDAEQKKFLEESRKLRYKETALIDVAYEIRAQFAAQAQAQAEVSSQATDSPSYNHSGRSSGPHGGPPADLPAGSPMDWDQPSPKRYKSEGYNPEHYSPKRSNPERNNPYPSPPPEAHGAGKGPRNNQHTHKSYGKGHGFTGGRSGGPGGKGKGGGRGGGKPPAGGRSGGPSHGPTGGASGGSTGRGGFDDEVN